MRDLTLKNITDVAVGSYEGLPEPRQRQLVQQLIKVLHGYAKDMQLTHDEWRSALQFLHRTAAITTDTRSEFSLLSDVLGLSSLVDLMASAPDATPGSVLGPFHATGSPWLDNPVNLIGANVGENVVLRGRVSSTDGKPLADATLDYWQNAANGLYWQLDPEQPADNLRCQLRVDAEGRFEIATIRPVPYEIPTDGPVYGELVQPAGRSSWRAAHAHVIVAAPGHRTLVTEIFDNEDPYLDTDAVFGVREALIGRYEQVTDAALCARFGWPGEQCLVLDVDVRLAPQS